MYIIYEGKLFDSIDEEEGLYLITRDKEKLENDYLKSKLSYYRIIQPDDPKIESIYDVKFYVYWDSQLENVEKKWRIQTSDYFSSGNVELCHEGYLPGWRVKEKGYSATQIDLDQMEGYSVEYIYVVKDGKKLEEPLIIEKDVNREEFEEIIKKYKPYNI